MITPEGRVITKSTTQQKGTNGALLCYVLLSERQIFVKIELELVIT